MTTPGTRIWLSWSSGKDSAFALHVLRERGFEVTCLLTTVNATHGRVAMHGVREELLAQQAVAVGVPLRRVDIPHPSSNGEYEERFGSALSMARAESVSGIAFGDLLLADVRLYRERQLAAHDLAAHFPLWGRDTALLAREMLASGIRARLVCVDPRRCPAALAGAEFDVSLLERLPANVDPCGENGEFHTFAYDGPGFARPLRVETRDVVTREGFVFADLCAASDA